MSSPSKNGPGFVRRASTWVLLFSLCFIFGFLVLAPAIQAIGGLAKKPVNKPESVKGGETHSGSSQAAAPNKSHSPLSTRPEPKPGEKNESVTVEVEDSANNQAADTAKPAVSGADGTGTENVTPAHGIDQDRRHKAIDSGGNSTSTTDEADGQKPPTRKKGRTRASTRAADTSEVDGTARTPRRRDDGVTKPHTLDE